MSEKKYKPHGANWKPGQSGNPGGRARGVERIAREAAAGRPYLARDGKTYTGAAAMVHVLIDIATDGAAKDRDRKDAAVAVLDRGWGKPKQTVEVTDAPPADLDLSAVTDAQLEALAALPLIDAEDEPGDATEH